MSTITGHTPPKCFPAKNPAPSETRNLSVFRLFIESRYETLPTEVLRRRIEEASLTNTELDRLIERSDRSWKQQWLDEPDPFTPE
jgi:hypothetical protein